MLMGKVTIALLGQEEWVHSDFRGGMPLAENGILERIQAHTCNISNLRRRTNLKRCSEDTRICAILLWPPQLIYREMPVYLSCYQERHSVGLAPLIQYNDPRVGTWLYGKNLNQLRIRGNYSFPKHTWRVHGNNITERLLLPDAGVLGKINAPVARTLLIYAGVLSFAWNWFSFRIIPTFMFNGHNCFEWPWLLVLYVIINKETGGLIK